MKIKDVTLVNPIRYFNSVHLINTMYDIELSDNSDFVIVNKKENLRDKYIIPFSNINQIHVCEEINLPQNKNKKSD
jgi:hypothetical protein